MTEHTKAFEIVETRPAGSMETTYSFSASGPGFRGTREFIEGIETISEVEALVKKWRDEGCKVTVSKQTTQMLVNDYE